MSEQIALVRGWVKLLATGDLDGALELMTDDVRIVEPAGLPYGGEFVGRDAFRDVESHVARTWEFLAGEVPPSRWAAGRDSVVRESHFVARSRATGRVVRGRIVQMFTLRGDRICEIVPYYWDTASYAAACGFTQE